MASITNGGPPRAGATSGEQQQQQHTLMALSRWSILDKSLPPVDSIKVLHVYDFDNTLFRTPLPNPALWSASSMGVLFSQDTIVNGGWWHDSRILHATGNGAEEEERRAWAGWWNETIVELVQLSSRQKDALCVLLTGRSEAGYRHLISRILRSRELEFDMVGLKPAVSPTSQTFDSTMHFKQLFLTALIETYSQADQIRVYEDRPKHVKGFRDFFANYNRQLPIGGGDGARGRRGPVAAEIVQVAELTTTLDPVVEVAQVQLMVNDHNAALAAVSQSAEAAGAGAGATARRGRLQLRKTVFYTGYMLLQADTLRLIALAKSLIPSHLPVQDLKFLANSVMICPRPAPATVLDRVGGMGAAVRWEVISTGCLEDCPLWAVRVRPVPPTARYYTENAFPLIVLALGRGARPFDAGRIHKWQPAGPADALVFDTTVGERMNLHLGFEGAREEDFGSPFSNKAHKRRHSPGENRPNKDLHTAAGQHHSHHHHHHQPQSQQQQKQQQQQQHHNSFHRANNQSEYGGSHSNNSSAHTSPYNPGRGRGGSAYGSYRGAGGGGSGGGRGRGGSAGGTPRAPFKQYSRGGGTPGGRGRGRGGGGGSGSGGFNYRSLDDVESRSVGVPVSYDDSTPASRPAGPPAGPQGWIPPQG